MVDPILARRWIFRLLFLAVAALLLFLRLLPLDTMPARWPGPDLLVCLTLAWILRRPEDVPVLLIAAVILVEDMFALRPPGLWPAIVLIGTEFLRAREALLRDLPFPAEWAMVSVVLLAMLAVNRLALTIFLIPQPALVFALVQMVVTVAAYPLVVLTARLAIGLRRPAPGEVEALGMRR